jgi:hypothetical protein
MEQNVIGIGRSLICLVRNKLEGTGKLGLVVKPQRPPPALVPFVCTSQYRSMEKAEAMSLLGGTPKEEQQDLQRRRANASFWVTPS